MLTVESVLELLRLCGRHHAVELKSECVDMIAANFDTVSKTQAFHEMLSHDPELVSDPLMYRAMA